MKKTYLEILSSVGAILLFIILIIVNNVVYPTNASYGNVAILLIFVIITGVIGVKLSEIVD